MQIGKLNITEWTWNNMQLANPILIIWKLIWIIPFYIGLGIFATIAAIFNLDLETFKDIINEHT